MLFDSIFIVDVQHVITLIHMYMRHEVWYITVLQLLILGLQAEGGFPTPPPFDNPRRTAAGPGNFVFQCFNQL